MSDLRGAILASERPYRDREAWGETVRVRGLTGAASERFSLRMQDSEEDVPDNVMAELLVRCLHDPTTDERIFADDDVGVVTELAGKELAPLFLIARTLSGLGDLDEAKNDSGATRIDASP